MSEFKGTTVDYDKLKKEHAEMLEMLNQIDIWLNSVQAPITSANLLQQEIKQLIKEINEIK